VHSYSTNRLAQEASAYLRQHMHNPVDWYPWGEEALSRAREEDRPLLVSIGYSACHWCHVMERESFEDHDTAGLMNALFVNIKVDREERPDVDQLYMDTVVRLTGHGGWPLTVFCTPEGKPFYGGTYFPPEARQGMPSFQQVLEAVSDAYQNRRGEVEEQAEQILASLEQRPEVQATMPSAQSLAPAIQSLLASADTKNGGFGAAPKFPTPTNLEFLLVALDFLEPEPRAEVLKVLETTATEMARRGLYDHLGGGFHRYCVDGNWTIPHFEKMLYDQGLLMRCYAELHRRTGDAEYAWPQRETARYLRSEMTAEEGGFYASQDADSGGVEGSYYVWTPAQLEEVLGDEAADFGRAYSVDTRGNFEQGTTHLVDCERAPRDKYAPAREKLLAVRQTRIAPATDPKRVAAWNGYAISGLARSATVLGDEALLREGCAAMDFVLARMVGDGSRLFRVFDAGKAHVAGFLDDYASILDACVELYRAGAGPRYLESALQFAERIATHFFDPEVGDLFLCADDAEKLAHRPRSDHDGATPQASGLATLGLLRCAELAGNSAYREVAEQVIRSHAAYLERAPAAFPTLLRAVALQARGLAVAVIIGEPAQPRTRLLANAARLALTPDDAVIVHAPGAVAPAGLDPSWLAGRSLVDGGPAAYVCRGAQCTLPLTDPDQFSDASQLELSQQR